MTDRESNAVKWRRPVWIVGLVAVLLIGTALLHRPGTPLPDQWNVFEPLVVAGPITPLTSWKLDWATQDPKLCREVLAEAGAFEPMEDLVRNESCGITGRIALRAVGEAQIAPLGTACATALRLAMWDQHGIQPAAQQVFGQKVTRIRHIGSYNCRRIAGSSRMSTHSTAEAIDITGFDLADGTAIRLKRDWTGPPDRAAFLKAVRNSSCDWFGTALGPEYNAAHADHFHLQNNGWGTCR